MARWVKVWRKCSLDQTNQGKRPKDEAHSPENLIVVRSLLEDICKGVQRRRPQIPKDDAYGSARHVYVSGQKHAQAVFLTQTQHASDILRAELQGKGLVSLRDVSRFEGCTHL